MLYHARATRSLTLILIAVLGFATGSQAATIISYNAPAASLDFNGNTVTGADALNVTDGTVALTGPYLIAEDTNALHALADGSFLLSTESPNTINGNNYQPEDVVLYDPNTNSDSLVFDGEALFATTTEIVDAVFLYESGPNVGDLLLSTASPATLGDNALAFQAGDIVRFDGTDAFMFFDASTIISGTGGQQNAVDGVHLLPNGNLILSVVQTGGDLPCTTDPACVAGLLEMNWEDLIEWDGANATIFHDGSSPPLFLDGVTPTAEQTNAVTITVPEPATSMLLGLGLLAGIASRRRTA